MTESADWAKQLLTAMQSVKESQVKLEEIALKPRVFTDTEYFDQMIKQEEEEKRPGWKQRQLKVQAMRDEVLAMEEFSKAKNLNDLFPQYQAQISKAIRNTGQDRPECAMM